MLTTIPHNTVLQGHVLDQLRELPNNCVDVVVTSTPYYGLRDYGPECTAVWDGEAGCEHDWQTKNTLFHGGNAGPKQQTNEGSFQSTYVGKSGYCSKCGAWEGQLGLEPHPTMFIEHLAQVFNEIKRVLKPSGSLWLNLGDTYYGGCSGSNFDKDTGSTASGSYRGNKEVGGGGFGHIKRVDKIRSNWLQPKQKMLIPARVAIALQDQGWILRNEIVWHKVNHMPESVRDRLTRSWESIFFFTKTEKYHFDLNAIRKPHATACGRSDRKLSKAIHFGKSSTFNGGSSYNSLGGNPGDVWSLTNEGLKDEHFAAFPQKLVKRILECSMPKGGLLLDPFAGAGTSLLVAHKMGFDWLGIELVPKYCKIIEKRIDRHGRVRLDGFLSTVGGKPTTVNP